MKISLEELLTPEIHRPARYLGNEMGSHHKPWSTAQVHWVLTYPEVYELGASNLGHIILYNILNSQPRQLCDRVYLPAPDLAERLRQTQTPLFALESRRPLTDFEIIGFSLSYELGATNILEMLTLAGIPLTWAEREQGNYPLIFAGGQTATSNPEPYADFFDFMVLGDGEEVLPEIGLVVQEGLSTELPRRALLLDLAQIPGVYVPCFYERNSAGKVQPNHPEVPERILRRVATPLPHYSIGPVAYIETIHDRLTLEIRRGCTRGCRFCQPGMLTRPARDVQPEAILETVEKGIRTTGYNEISLLSLSCSDYLGLSSVGLEIRNRLQEDNISLSLPSQRVDRFDENIANIIGGTRQSSLTFAPEAGSQRLRDIINKGLTNEELLRGIKTAVEQGWDRVKLYFMIGLPGETDADILGIAETLRFLRRECRLPKRKSLEFTLTLSNFTPKPHTPFQWHAVSKDEFIRKQNLLKEELRGMRGVKVNYTDVRISAMEDFIGRGDRRLAPVVRRAWELGAGMDAWWESTDKAYAAWTQAILESGLTWKYRQVEAGEGEEWRDLDAPLPWDHINSGVEKQWLKEDFVRALAAATVPDCSFEGCSHCGVCGVDLGHNVIVPPPPIPAFAGEFQPQQERAQRLRVWFGKQGDLALVSHLDLVRLFDRLVRRACLPISYTGGFHPGPRISIANALSLGATSSGEIVDFELTQEMEVEEFRRRLQEQLPPEMPIYAVEAVSLLLPSATRLLEKAEYLLTLSSLEALTADAWQRIGEQVLACTEILFAKTSKSGKVAWVNLRDRLFNLELVSCEPSVILRYIGSCRNDGTLLQPEQVLYMLQQQTSVELYLDSIHRQRLIFSDFLP
jgi:radical SAM family uncharacterized protein/radical SAM-linked protein